MKSNARHYFPGGNTPMGFVSYYGDILSQSEATAFFCIKGGPGTGKSTFMKEIGLHYLDKGYDVDFLKCSSDPKSLDGILINQLKVAIIDGTKPHVVDPVNPGAVDEILNFGEFLENDKLRMNKERIITLNKEISETFEHAYTYLKCADVLYREVNDIKKKYVNEENIIKLLSDIRLPQKGNRCGNKKRYFGSSITYKGNITEIKTLSKDIENIYLLELPEGYRASNHTDILSQRIMTSGYDVEELFCPMCPKGLPEHIMSPDAGIAVFSCNSHHGIGLYDNNNIKGIVKVEARPISSIDRQIIGEMIDYAKDSIEKAVKILSTAKRLHDDLETYYIEAMDFKALQDLKSIIINRIDRLIA